MSDTHQNNVKKSLPTRDTTSHTPPAAVKKSMFFSKCFGSGCSFLVGAAATRVVNKKKSAAHGNNMFENVVDGNV